ncbi:mutanase Pc12g07500 [Colletotrichum spaethianum]|uniref:chitinase n=1 Tax=Colletotrichum spaethianum TaxID=700344 RepID=A0AA37PES9_9PEZI|nr:mutanase Pc12g07500 [Colletotrichum spaethianum]GKT50966.1 mutanase Pc12g07500 [Colletotrichum spaethianum]
MLFLATLLLAALLATRSVESKSVFAHFMVGNTETFDIAKWEDNIALAQQAHIDAFALNIAHGWKYNDQQISNAFAAAGAKGFKLFFSFDYAGGDVPWPMAEVKALIQKYGSSQAHFQYNGKPFVSTFEGPDNADDWKSIKADTGCFFIPDWSSLGAGPAINAGDGVADGLFNWAAWPYGQRNMTTYIDASYNQLLGGKPYMMPVSPWFFTNLPGYSKNWLWKSGDLWYERWKQVVSMDFEPEFLEIISWNDYGESHYIGPLDNTQYEAFQVGDAPYNYVKDMPHDGWREHLPYLIDLYKTGTASFTKESMVTWFRTSLSDTCADGGTTGNTASQLQLEYEARDLTPDRIYFSVLLASSAELKVSFGGRDYSIKDWDYIPDGGVGVYHTSIPVLGTGGAWHAQVVRGSSTIIDYLVPQGISGDCPSGVTNWNPWVGSASSGGSVSGKPPRDLADQVCIAGWGEGNFNDLCEFTCKYGYCPSSACVCTNMGEAIKKPESTGVKGYPANGDANYGGLCTFACNLGYCPSTACATEEQREYVPTTSPFNPNTCVTGGGHGSFSRICSWACHYGFCPILSCFCSMEGPLNLPPPVVKVSGIKSNLGNDNGLCAFACSHGYCPSPECSSDDGDTSDGSGGSSSAMDIIVGYFQADSISRRGCGQRPANFVPTDSVSHINVAFGWIEAGTFALIPDANGDEDQLRQLAALKGQATGLHVWLTLGGYDFSTGSRKASGTQGIFSDIASTHENRQKFLANLVSFLQKFGFDGVDIDWRWPQTGEDATNYVILLDEMREYFDTQSAGSTAWGISSTLPVDTTILGRFDLASIAASTNWINLVAFDIESTDKSTTRAMSDKSSIDASLGFLTNAGVPHTQINLGIGFFGRTYALSDKSCTGLGCSASGFGVAGKCSGQPGFMSYDEIQSELAIGSGRFDDKTGTNYLSYGDAQWISYEDRNSIIEKVKYAKSKGLLGVAAWAIDLDDDNHQLLNATLYPGGLGSLSLTTGTNHDDSSNYTNVDISSCSWSDCTTSGILHCPVGQQRLISDRCSVDPRSGAKRYKALCCPLGQTPDPKTCGWNRLDGGDCSGSGCDINQVSIASDKWFINNKGVENYCFYGSATFCCDAVETGVNVCDWDDICVNIGSNGLPMVWRWGFVDGGESKCASAKTCPIGKTAIATSNLGGGADCTYSELGGSTFFNPALTYNVQRTLCADPNALRRHIDTLPIPLENIFPHPGPSTDKQKWDVKLDPTMGGADPTPEESTNADKNSFGWYIMSGPEAELTSLNKRDGSHWELFDCEAGAMHEKRHTVRAVCTDNSDASNCGIIHKGRGVAETVVEMPEGCGPGRYAMAVSLTPSDNQTLPHRLVKRNPQLADAYVYDFTFDYDFSPLRKRGRGSNVLLRIDYSDDPGYWSDIVAAAPTKLKRSKRQIEEEVHRDHNGSYKKYMYHLWSIDKRSTSQDELHELHARWFSKSGAIKDWIDRFSKVDAEYELVRHRVNEQIRWNLYDESIACKIKGVDTVGYFKAWADLNVNIETSALVTLIGNMGDLSTFDESHVLFRNSGSVKASLNVEALVTLHFLTGQIELFGLQNFGATFSVPGIVTIGPNFRVLGQLQGTATMHGQARVDLRLAEWDFTHQFPDANGGMTDVLTTDISPKYSGATSADPIKPLQEPEFYYDVSASGELNLMVTPKVTLGIVFNDDSIPDASIDFGVNGAATWYGSAGSNSDTAWEYCYGVNAQAEMFAEVSAPSLFGVSLNRYYSIWSTGTFPIVEKKCAAAAPSLTQTQPSKRSAKLVKRDNLIGSLICPAESTANASDVGTCPVCGVNADSSGSRRVKKRYGYILEERADACPLLSSDICSYADSSSVSGRSTPNNDTTPSLVERQANLKEMTVTFGGKYPNIDLDVGRYAPCGKAKNSPYILKNIVTITPGLVCSPTIVLMDDATAKALYSEIGFETEHIYEPQTLTAFYEWLGKGAGTTVGAYSMATPEWVAEVLLGELKLGGTGQTFQFDQSFLGITVNPQGNTVHETLALGFGRSDTIRVGNKFSKERSESHLALVQWETNNYKGVWMGGGTPRYNPTKVKLKNDRQTLRDIMATFTFLKFVPPNALTGQKYAKNEAIWNKWMRVSNWFDFVFSEFDRQFTAINGWNFWPGHPVNNAGGNPSLRALYAEFIEDQLATIERNVATFLADAERKYLNVHAPVNPQGVRVWDDDTDPAWYYSAFGPGGWATAPVATFPRVAASNGWSVYGATGHLSMMVDGAGNFVTGLAAPDRI